MAELAPGSYLTESRSEISLGLPSYVLPLNLDFASVLRLGMRYVNQMSQVNFLPVQSTNRGSG